MSVCSNRVFEFNVNFMCDENQKKNTKIKNDRCLIQVDQGDVSAIRNY